MVIEVYVSYFWCSHVDPPCYLTWSGHHPYLLEAFAKDYIDFAKLFEDLFHLMYREVRSNYDGRVVRVTLYEDNENVHSV